jgi:hypothetical protein
MCEGLLGRTYIRCSVLLIKLGVVNWYQSSADRKTLNLIRNGSFIYGLVSLSLPFILIKPMLNSSSLFY